MKRASIFNICNIWHPPRSEQEKNHRKNNEAASKCTIVHPFAHSWAWKRCSPDWAVDPKDVSVTFAQCACNRQPWRLFNCYCICCRIVWLMAHIPGHIQCGRNRTTSGLRCDALKTRPMKWYGRNKIPFIEWQSMRQLFVYASFWYDNKPKSVFLLFSLFFVAMIFSPYNALCAYALRLPVIPMVWWDLTSVALKKAMVSPFPTSLGCFDWRSMTSMCCEIQFQLCELFVGRFHFDWMWNGTVRLV